MGVVVGGRLRRIGVDDKRDLSRKIIDNGELFGEKEQDVRHRGERIDRRARGPCELALDVTHGVVAEVPGEPAAEARQTRYRRRAIASLELGDEIERIAAMALGDRGAVANFDALPARADARRRRQAYERVAAEALAADYRFQEKGVRPVGELDVERKRRVEIGERLEDKRDAVKSLRGKRAEFGFGHDASTIVDLRYGLRKRRLRRATRALA